ncbi:hypothetical protein [endosymbiont GvMRE of Glomus versiforme]|uniref:hypothetical protein n=1 Tax=endosymbiont GvMRE of Glomus versiforme TaxID=2039283 RepID=UPI000EC036F7|nr:hypothetical protein [endosymbiont GvMRE of Glomus versiforme]RHZ36018.1 hypothetical protein GvMRE_Ic3g74 [endosymbiont GvMRE of Glomus versiforme]
MSLEERIAKLNETKEKLEKWDSSLSEMIEFLETVFKEINKDFSEDEKVSDEEMKIVQEINKIERNKTLEFVDKWHNKNFQFNDKEIERLETELLNIWNKINELKNYKKNEAYEKNDDYRQKVDKKEEEELEPFQPYQEKLLFLISRHYEDKKKKTSSTSNNSTNSKTLPWTLAIIFGITTVISAGIAIYLFWKQRKIKKFKV